jgi:tRNA-dihydrouridine synthase
MFAGVSNWGQLTDLKARLKIPVIGSGDLFTALDCHRMLTETGCDGVMVARGSLGAPWIFRQICELEECGTLTPVSNADRAAAIRLHLEMYTAEYGEAIAAREMKKHIGWYAKGFSGASDIRREANNARSTDDIHALAERINGIPDTP